MCLSSHLKVTEHTNVWMMFSAGNRSCKLELITSGAFKRLGGSPG